LFIGRRCVVGITQPHELEKELAKEASLDEMRMKMATLTLFSRHGRDVVSHTLATSIAFTYWASTPECQSFFPGECNTTSPGEHSEAMHVKLGGYQYRCSRASICSSGLPWMQKSASGYTNDANKRSA
jgi:hypothetical protein